MGREVGGGIGMGNTCKSIADSCHVWQKPLQYCKVISLQLIKINKNKKEVSEQTHHQHLDLEILAHWEEINFHCLNHPANVALAS